MAAMKEKTASLYNGRDEEQEKRSRVIVRTSVIGILANILLAAFKAVIGVVSGSIAITMDAVNNLSDAGSSIITIIGTKLAGRPADKKHPFGYGRIEYLSAMVISVIVLYAGITSFTESVKKVLHPELPDYGIISLVIVAAGVVVKLVLGSYVKKKGTETGSDSLVNSGEDARNDAVISAATLVAAVLYLTLHISIEAWLGAVISIVIIKSGIDMLKDTLSEILGEAAGAATVIKVKKIVMSHPEVRGAYDLVLNNYGPDAFNGSVHIEVDDTMDMDALDQLIRDITKDVYLECHIILTAVGIYAINTKDPAAAEARKTVGKTVMAVEHVKQMHGFHLDEKAKEIRFDLVVSFDAENRMETFQKAVSDVQKLYPDYTIEAVMDTDFTEIL